MKMKLFQCNGKFTGRLYHDTGIKQITVLSTTKVIYQRIVSCKIAKNKPFISVTDEKSFECDKILVQEV